MFLGVRPVAGHNLWVFYFSPFKALRDFSLLWPLIGHLLRLLSPKGCCGFLWGGGDWALLLVMAPEPCRIFYKMVLWMKAWMNGTLQSSAFSFLLRKWPEHFLFMWFDNESLGGLAEWTKPPWWGWEIYNILIVVASCQNLLIFFLI